MAEKKRIGVLLCGCGHRDGSEIHEATLTLLAIDHAGAQAYCMAPAGPQRFVRDHCTGAEVEERRDMRVESARISRGNIRNLAHVRAADIDALIIPGGQGAAQNLSSFLVEGVKCTVHPEVERLVREMAEARKPIGAICIAPATLARIFDRAGISAVLTCGTDQGVAEAIASMGQEHEPCEPTDCVVDQEQRVVTTPAYMDATSIGEVWQGIRKLVDAIVEMA